MFGKLEDKVAILTGGGQGIGAGRKRHVSAGRNARPELLRRPAQASGHLAEVPELNLGVPTVD